MNKSIPCASSSLSSAFASSSSSSHCASSRADRFLGAGITLLKSDRTFSRGRLSNGTSWFGSGVATDEEERAEEGTISMGE